MRDRIGALVRRVLSPAAIASLKRSVGRVCSRNLTLLASLYDSDKGRQLHSYTEVYPIHFGSLRRSVRSVLEVGIGGYEHAHSGGASLRMWQAYFPKAHIVGIDLYPKHVVEPRVTAEVCDQSDPSALVALVDRHGPFDVVIDDGSHIGAHIWTTFETLFPSLPDGAIYVIEDLQTSYAAKYGGGPRGTPGTGVDLVKSMVDRLHLSGDVGRVDVHEGIAFIHKGPSATVAMRMEARGREPML